MTISLIILGAYLVNRKPWWEMSFSDQIFILMGIMIMFVFLFIVYFLLLTKKFITYIKVITEGIEEISQGNLENRIIIENGDEFSLIAKQLNHMASDIKRFLENERKSEQANKELITSVAHDLCTPLTSIIGYLDLVASKELTQEQYKKYIEIAYNKSKRLEKLIKDLFSYTKFSFDEVKLKADDVDVVKLLEQLVDEFYPSFAENNMTYQVTYNVPTMIIRADGDLLARALANLISNGIKYGVKGKRMDIEIERSQDKVTIAITNYGEIIPAEKLELIFQRFYRLESSRSSDTGGSGLGLAIAERIIRNHGGVVYANSDSLSTKFTVELPY